MKIIAIGDIHGRDFWKDILQEPMDQLVFIGDYFDSYGEEFTAKKEIENFKQIIEIKRENPDLVTLLIGNHDYHYLSGVNEQYSRYQYAAAADINVVLMEALELMQMCYVYNDIVFNHAGITKTWAQNQDIDLDNLQTSINHKFREDQAAFGFVYGIDDDDGSDRHQSPIWVRPQALLEDKIEGYHQVVGHTIHTAHRIQDGIAFIDVPDQVFRMESADDFDWSNSQLELNK